MTEIDRRVQKTKYAIYQALSTLMEEKKYGNITVQEIIDRANVGRSTFYTHFETKDELLNSLIDNIFASFNKHLDGHKESGPHRFIPVEELLIHIQDNKKRIKGAFADENGEVLKKRFKEFWNVYLQNYFEQNMPMVMDIFPMDFLVNHISGSLVEMLQWWVNGGMKYSPQEMNQYWEKLMGFYIKGMHE